MSLTSNLTAYVDQTSAELIKKSVLENKTSKVIRRMAGVKTSLEIPVLSNTIKIQKGGSCSLQNSGGTSLNPKTITTYDCGIQFPICVDTLEQTAFQAKMNPGSYNEDIPFEQFLIDSVIEDVSAEIENLMWNGKYSVSDGNLTVHDGFIQLLTGTSFSSSCVNVTSITGFTTSNAIASVNTIISEMAGAAYKTKDMAIFMSIPNLLVYQDACVAANYVNANPLSENFEMMVPFKNVKIYGIDAFENANRIIMAPTSNLVQGNDLISDTEQMKVWFENKEQSLYFLMKWKQGAQIIYPDWVVNAKIN